MNSVGELFEAYELYRVQTGALRKKGYLPRTLKRTPEREKAIAGMLQWCTEKRIDPYLWLYLLFDARHWRWAPKWTALTSEKLLPRYPKFQQRVRDLPLFRRARAIARARTQENSAATIWANVTGTVEQRKRYLVNGGQHELCMSLLETETLGYHPRSLVCVRCPARVACAERLRAYAGEHVLAMRQ